MIIYAQESWRDLVYLEIRDQLNTKSDSEFLRHGFTEAGATKKHC